MCLEDDVQVPAGADPIIELTSADGSRFGAYMAEAENPTGVRLVLLPDIGGMRAPFRDLARRFARTGADVLVIDYYGRMLGPEARGEEHDPETTSSFDRDLVLDDLAAAVTYLRGYGDGPIYAAGFCIGGANALYAGTVDLGLAGVIGICPYVGPMGASAALPEDFSARIRVPVLGLFGGADTEVPSTVHENLARHLTAADVPHENLARHLTAADVPHEIMVFPGQPHGFIEWDHFGRDGHAEAAAEAWARITSFLRTALSAA